MPQIQLPKIPFRLPPKNIQDYDTSGVVKSEITSRVDGMIRAVDDMRAGFERNWYDNRFFDDGYHFRYVDRTVNKIVNLSPRALGLDGAVRAIPKATRQIRGISNLLMSSDPTPVVYPEKTLLENQGDAEKFKQAREQATVIAKRIGHWVTEEWEEQDLLSKLTNMVLLTAREGISWMQVWPDHVQEKIRTQVFDAFDIKVLGMYSEVEDLPFIVKSTPQLMAVVRANEYFDEEAKMRLLPDNKVASSSLKEAYQLRRFGKEQNNQNSATVMIHEAFIKEYINSDNLVRISKQKNSDKIMEDRKEGDVVIRHTFTTDNAVMPLRDEYLVVDSYPFVDFRFEPGPLYQTPFMNRLIPANKSLDLIASRVEKFTNAMTVGVWMKPQGMGNNLKVSNIPGGQQVEYKGAPPQQAQMAPIPAHVFAFMDFLGASIEEGGVSTTTLNKLPTGVRSGNAIESLKESEYANLVIASRQLKSTIKRITQKFINISSDHFYNPQSVFFMEQGEPNYFTVIGQAGIDRRKELGFAPPEEAVVLKKDLKVEIEVENGLGFTRQGQIDRAVQLANFMLQMAQAQMIPPQAVQVFIQQLLEVFQFGSVSEIMDAMKAAQSQAPTTQDQIKDTVKLGMAEFMQDSKDIRDQENVATTKLGVAQTMEDMQNISKQPNGKVA